MTNTGKLEVIQALRGIAAVGVLLWHTSKYLGPYGEGIGGALFLPGSIMCVDLFFVICGFVMVISSTRREGAPRSVLDFIIRRFSRIYPVYVLATLLTFYLQWDVPQQTFGRLASSLLFYPGNDAGLPTIGWPTLNVGWTINYEVYFYLVLTACLALGRRYLLGVLLWAVLVLVVPAGLAGRPLFNAYSTISALPPFAQLLTNPLNWLFVAGIVIAQIYQSSFIIKSRRLAVGLCVAVVALTALQYYTQFRFQHGLFKAGLSVVPLVAVLVVASKTIALSPPRVLVYLGRISFSLYLLHPSIMDIYAYFTTRFGVADAMGGWIAIVLISVASCAAATLSFRYIESGLCEWVRKQLQLLLQPGRKGTAEQAIAQVR